MISGDMLRALQAVLSFAERSRRVRHPASGRSATLERLTTAVDAALDQAHETSTESSKFDSGVHDAAADVSACGQTDVRGSTSTAGAWLTSNDIADRLGCSPRNARRIARQLGATRVGGRWQLDEISLQDHQERNAS